MSENKVYKHGLDVRLKAVGLFEEGYGYKKTASCLNICKAVVGEWFYKFHAFGREELLKMSGSYTKYTFEQKVEACKAIVDEGMTKQEAMARFQIKSLSALKRWCKTYQNGGSEALRSKAKGRPKGSKSSPNILTREQELEERVQDLETEVAYLKKLKALVEENNL